MHSQMLVAKGFCHSKRIRLNDEGAADIVADSLQIYAANHQSRTPAQAIVRNRLDCKVIYVHVV
jgi:hypothetical protein